MSYPFPEIFLSIIGYHFPFNKFEVSISNHLLITHSQLHLVSWDFILVFLYSGEYKGGKLIATLFFHLFNIQNILI